MCGCCNAAVVLISARNRSAPITAASSGRSTLTATLRSCLRSCARYTVAMPPAPSSRSSLYRSASASMRRGGVSSIVGCSMGEAPGRPMIRYGARQLPSMSEIPLRRSGGRSEEFRHRRLPVAEDARELKAYERRRCSSKHTEGQRVDDLVLDVGAAVQAREAMRVHPRAIRTGELLIDELFARLPFDDASSPPQRDSPQPDRVVDECARTHLDGLRRRDREPELGWGDAAEIRRVREEGERGVEGNGDVRARTEMVDGWHAADARMECAMHGPTSIGAPG